MSDIVAGETTVADYRMPLEPDEESVPIPHVSRETTLEDVYALLVDMHRMQAAELTIFQGIASLVNEAGAQLPDLMEQIQDSPLFSMFSGGGGGLLGSFFRR